MTVPAASAILSAIHPRGVDHYVERANLPEHADQVEREWRALTERDRFRHLKEFRYKDLLGVVLDVWLRDRPVILSIDAQGRRMSVETDLMWDRLSIETMSVVAPNSPDAT